MLLLGACAAQETTAEEPAMEEEVAEAPAAEEEVVEEAPAEEEAMEPFRVAVVMPSAINDLAFSQSMYEALLFVQEEMGGESAF